MAGISARPLARAIKQKLFGQKDRLVVNLSETPAHYRPLVSKIMKYSPIWGSHQTIVFPDGYVLQGGRDNSRIEMFDIAADLKGNTVLDIGCNIGGIARECKQRNADRVVGLDKSTGLLECANDLSAIFNLDIEYRTFDLLTDELDESFDYVFFLNVFHHLDENGKIKALRTLDRITRKRMFFEAPIHDDIVAGQSKWLTTDDYMCYLKGFTSFSRIELTGQTDFERPLITCDR